MVKTKLSTIIITLIGVLLLFTSCKKNDKAESSSYLAREIENVDFGSYSFESEATFGGDVIINSDIAEQYANIVFRDTLGKDLKQFNVVTVSFDSKNSIWVINYCINEQTVGEDVSIAISKKTGEIKKIWFGE